MQNACGAIWFSTPDQLHSFIDVISILCFGIRWPCEGFRCAGILAEQPVEKAHRDLRAAEQQLVNRSPHKTNKKV